jgi:hypothetical protein
MSVFPQIMYGHMALIFLSHFYGYKKMKYCQTIRIHRIFLNVVTFSVTNSGNSAFCPGLFLSLGYASTRKPRLGRKRCTFWALIHK